MTQQQQPNTNVTTMGVSSTSNVIAMPNQMRMMGPGITSSTTNVMTSSDDELTPEEQAEIQRYIAQSQQQIATQMVARSAPSSQQQQQQGMLQSIINAGSAFWNILALPSRADQASAWAKQKYENFTKQQRLINLKDRTGVQYRPSPSLNIIAAQGPEGLVVADRNYKSGVAQITALVELLRMYDILKEKLPSLQNSVNPIDIANAVSIQRQYAESYFLFVYLNQLHINAAIESIRLLERAPSITTSKTIGRAPSITTVPSSSMIPGIWNREETVTTLDQRTIETLNAAYNLLNRNAITSVSSILGEQVQSSRLPTITVANMPAAEVLYNSIVQKRTVAIGFIHKDVKDRIISSGPLAGLAVAYLQNSNNVNINNISSDMIASEEEFDAYIKQIVKKEITPKPINIGVLRDAQPLPNTSRLRGMQMLSTSNVMGSSGNNNANDGSSGNEQLDSDDENLGGGGRRHKRRRTQKHRHRRTNAKKQSRRSRQSRHARRR